MVLTQLPIVPAAPVRQLVAAKRIGGGMNRVKLALQDLEPNPFKREIQADSA
jgi:hypothetical protein